MTRLGALLERYGPALRADFAEVYGADLAELLAARRFRHVLDLVDELPRTSRLAALQQTDIGLVEALPDSALEASQAPELDPRALSEWTLTNELLAAVFDTLQQLTAITARAKKSPKPMPRPRTALQVERARRQTARANEIINIFTPHRGR